MAALPAAGGKLLGAQASGDYSPASHLDATRNHSAGPSTQHTALDHFKAGVADDTATESGHIDQVCRCQVEEYYQAVTCLSINRPSPSSIWPTCLLF